MSTGPRIAVVVSHPIQHFCPQYESWAQSADWALKVFFASTAGLEAYEDRNFRQQIKWEGVTLDFPHVFLNEGENILPSSRLDARDLKKELEGYKPDVVIIYGYVQKLQRRALHWARRHKAKVLMISDSESHSPRPVYKKIIKGMVLPRIFERVDGFLTVGDANEEYYRQYGGSAERFFRMFFPINYRQYQEKFHIRDELRSSLRERYGIPEDHFVISMAGKLVDWKRQEDLIHAHSLLSKSHPDTTALIIGSGADQDRLEGLVTPSGAGGVIFTGFVQPEELPAYYAATDVYVHASSFEPHSLAISEAIYMGCPVVISNHCGSYGPTDDVRPGHNGFVYQCGSSEELSDNLLRLAKDSSLRKEFGLASHQFAEAHQRLAHGDGLRQALKSLKLLQ